MPARWLIDRDIAVHGHTAYLNAVNLLHSKDQKGTIQMTESKETPNLIVASKAKEIIKSFEMNCGGDFIEALSNRVAGLIGEAVASAKENKRKTLRAEDMGAK